MEELLETLLTNKIFILITVLVIALLVYSLLKRLLKLIIFILIALMLYVGYMTYTGQKLPRSSEEFIKQGTEKLNEIQKGSRVIIDSIQRIKKTNEVLNGSEDGKNGQ